jgi:hypothetical protein
VNNAQAKLSTALNNIAYHHVQKYANAIKAHAKANAAAVNAVNAAAANPTAANANAAAAAVKRVNQTGEAVAAAEAPAAAAANLAAKMSNAGSQTTPAAANAALNAETQTINATNAFMKRINTITNANNMNHIFNSNNFKGLSANNQGKVRNYSRAKFPITSAPVTGVRGTSVSLVKNSPNASWRFRKVNANKGYILTNANTNSPKVYYSANILPK